MEAIRTPVPVVRSGPRFGRLARSLPDSRLAARVRTGDQAAFEALFERYHRPLLAFCRHMLGTREEAEDALQHIFVAAHRQLVSGDDRVVELRPWLYAVARNRCLSVLRARRDAVALDDVAEPPGAGLAVAEEVQQREDLQAVLADLARLPDEQREALVLSELGALSHDEVASVLGVRRDKVKALVFQARESLAGWRQARDLDCREIREQLATLRGAALRRGPLRKHLETCDGCRAFRTEVRHQREALALLLPVIPSVALKAKILGAVTAGGHLVPVAGAGVAGSTGAGLAGATGSAAAGGGVAGLAGGLAAKALLVAAIAGTAGGGYAVLHESGSPHRAAPATRVIAPAPRTPLPAASPTAAPTPTAALAPLAEARARAAKAHRANPDHTGRGGSAKAKAKAKAEAKAKTEAKAKAKAEGTPAKGEHGPSSAAKEARHGRPAVPGDNGFRHAPKSQGLRHRRSDPPAHGARGTAPGRGSASGASAGRGAEAATPRSESGPPHPPHPAHPDVPGAGRLVPATS